MQTSQKTKRKGSKCYKSLGGEGKYDQVGTCRGLQSAGSVLFLDVSGEYMDICFIVIY